MAHLILASESPRRAALLAQVGIVPDAIMPAAIDEAPHKGEVPRGHALRLAMEKARAVAAQKPGCFVLAADTVVGVGRRILPKADDAAMVTRCLTLLSGRRHQVTTAVALVTPDGKLRSRVAMTRVSVLRLTADDIAAYAASREGEGKAGGYAIQGRFEAHIKEISGSYSNVVGLPLAVTVALLKGVGA